MRAIKALARQQRISQAEAVRRAIRAYLAARPAPGPDSAAFGLWADRQDGLDDQRRLRDERAS